MQHLVVRRSNATIQSLFSLLQVDNVQEECCSFTQFNVVNIAETISCLPVVLFHSLTLLTKLIIILLQHKCTQIVIVIVSSDELYSGSGPSLVPLFIHSHRPVTPPAKHRFRPTLWCQGLWIWAEKQW